jgi:DNA-directed RNA polymerase subunit RPC12/RpoP
MVHLKRPEDKYACSKCNSSHVDIYNLDSKKYISCLDCGHEEEIN